MDEAHLYNAFAYVVLSPVRAKLAKRSQDWQWSSIHAHLDLAQDGITQVKTAADRVGNFKGFLKTQFDEESFQALRGSKQTGRPIGSDHFIEKLEKNFNRKLKPQKEGQKF